MSRRVRLLLVPLVVVALAAAPAASAAPPGPAPTGAAAAGGRVIVVFKDQLPRLSVRPATLAQRRAAVGAIQRPVLDELADAGATHVRRFLSVNALGATVSTAEAARLAANPAVREVVPDSLVHVTRPAAETAATGVATPHLTAVPHTCAANSGVQLEPEALGLIHAESATAGTPTAHSLGYTGKGVKIGVIADGVDIKNADLIRSDGTRVVTTYRDFVGDGTTNSAASGEAFLDDSALAAQGRKVYDVSGYSARPLSAPCRIRIKGVAPGASLVQLSVFGRLDSFFTTSFLSAVDYAVTVAHVDVLNESLCGNRVPDTAADLMKQANVAATEAGVTVVTSSGDGGTTNTLATPGTAPGVINVGATTSFRTYLQVARGGSRLPAVKGWKDNNISAFSSSGWGQDGRTLSLVAPGDANWSFCTASSRFSTCTDDSGRLSSAMIEDGTSQSAPFVAGTAALVIQAYRQTHKGDSPSPALVKQLIVSTATDTGAPAELQGAGLLNSYKAVVAARDYARSHSDAAASPLLFSRTQLNLTGSPSATRTLTTSVRNVSGTARKVTVSTRRLTSYKTLKTATVTLSDSASSHYTNSLGYPSNYTAVHFTVPAGVARLDGSIAYQADYNSTSAVVALALVDPNGKYSAYSRPLGPSNYGEAQVTKPAAGTWTAYVTSRKGAYQGTTGHVLVGLRTAGYATFGSASPASFTLAAGASRTVSLPTTIPASPGDSAGALLFRTAQGSASIPSTSSVPITVRSVVPAGTHTFTGVLRGGNGRAGVGQTNTYAIDVPDGQPALNSTVTFRGSPDNYLFAYLVSPTGETQAFASNQQVDNPNAPDQGPTVDSWNSFFQQGVQLHVLAPAAGRWTLVTDFQPTVSGTALTNTFDIEVDEQPLPVTATGLPTSAATVLPAGQPATVTVHVTNTGTANADYFVDPRSTSSADYPLRDLTADSYHAPCPVGCPFPVFNVPAHSTSAVATATTDGARPIAFSVVGVQGDPEIESTTGSTATANLTGAPLSNGTYYVIPQLVGAWGATGVATQNVTVAMTVHTEAFDRTVTSPTGDPWLLSVDSDTPYAPQRIAPGAEHDITVTITPAGTQGSVVSGTLYVSTASVISYGYLEIRGNAVAALPFTYTVG